MEIIRQSCGALVPIPLLNCINSNKAIWLDPKLSFSLLDQMVVLDVVGQLNRNNSSSDSVAWFWQESDI